MMMRKGKKPTRQREEKSPLDMLKKKYFSPDKDGQAETAEETVNETAEAVEMDPVQQELEAARAVAPKCEKTEDELEAYRRAERAERRAAERVAQLYDQANAALADAATRADASAAQVGQLADSLNLQLQQLLSAIASGKNTLLDAAAAMYAVRPLSEEE